MPPQRYDAMHPSLAPPVARLIEQLNKLPGIGPKSAQRLAYHIIRMHLNEATALAEAIGTVGSLIVFCSTCQNITEANPCGICANPARDNTRICVVQEPLDVLTLERTSVYNGLYHVLHGIIDPMNNVRPEDLRIGQLLERLNAREIEEVIVATNPTIEGEATSMYLQRIIAPLGPRITRLARGLPIGGDIEYADELTITKAFEGRSDF